MLLLRDYIGDLYTLSNLVLDQDEDGDYLGLLLPDGDIAVVMRGSYAQCIKVQAAVFAAAAKGEKAFDIEAFVGSQRVAKVVKLKVAPPPKAPAKRTAKNTAGGKGAPAAKKP